MTIALVRHAPADPRDASGRDRWDRALTPLGRRKARALAAGLRWLLRPAEQLSFRLVTSPWTRAAQTAEAIAKACDAHAQPDPRLGADQPLDAWLGALREHAAPAEARPSPLAPAAEALLCLVGHEPTLGEAAGWLLGGPAIPLRKGGVAVLETPEVAPGRARLTHLLPPRPVRRLGRKPRP